MNGRVKEKDCESLNEISTNNLATLAFPILFPDGQGDSLSNENLVEILKSDLESSSQKTKHLILGEETVGKRYFRLESDPRFGYWSCIVKSVCHKETFL